MARTPLFRSLQKFLRTHQSAQRHDVSVEAVREALAQEREHRLSGHAGARTLSRRELLGLGAAVTGGIMAPSLLYGAKGGGGGGPGGGSNKTIAIIGAGIAGLNAALVLADAGLKATVYEAAPRVGGRTRSDRVTKPGCGRCHDHHSTGTGTWADGQNTDIFGELIDTGHTVMRALADRYGLPLINLLEAEPAGATETYYFLGSHYPKAQADADFAAMTSALHSDLTSAGYPTTWNRSKPGGRALDKMSIYDWIETRVPGGHNGPLGRLLDVAYNIEFGAETTDQSALSLIYLLGYQPGGKTSFNVFGVSDERYRIAGGIERLPEAMYNDVATRGITFEFNHRLEAIEQTAGGTCLLDFDGYDQVSADIVLLALPFAVLKHIDTSKAGFDARKDLAIQTLGEGKNGKLHVQFNSRFWNQTGPWGLSGGSSYSDTGYQVTWEATRGQSGDSGILVFYTGGDVTEALAQGHAYASTTVSSHAGGLNQDVAAMLQRLAPVFPRPDLVDGIASFYNGRAAGSVAHLNPLFRASYSYWRVGQYQTIAGYEAVRQGNVLFAGEHTSVDFQGWMEGAVREGARAGKEIAASV